MHRGGVLPSSLVGEHDSHGWHSSSEAHTGAHAHDDGSRAGIHWSSWGHSGHSAAAWVSPVDDDSPPSGVVLLLPPLSSLPLSPSSELEAAEPLELPEPEAAVVDDALAADVAPDGCENVVPSSPEASPELEDEAPSIIGASAKHADRRTPSSVDFAA